MLHAEIPWKRSTLTQRFAIAYQSMPDNQAFSVNQSLIANSLAMRMEEMPTRSLTAKAPHQKPRDAHHPNLNPNKQIK